MATIKVEIRSREMIKPSSPTPPHLKTLPLSFLDTMAPPIHISLTFFYLNTPINDQLNGEILSTLLKRSLSETLVYFYPLAGRLEGNVSINCNDEGVEYNEAYVSTQLSTVVANAKLLDELIMELLPFGPTDRKTLMLGIQVNHFSCGGMAIGVRLSHKIADGKGFSDFVNAWATITRAIIAARNTNNLGDELGENIIRHPKFEGWSYFPPRDDLGGAYAREVEGVGIYKGKVVRKRFVFEQNMIKALKKKIVDELNNGINESSDSTTIKSFPTRVEVVTAFIWKRVMEATGVRAVGHVVDIRNRMIAPSIPQDIFGNFCSFANTPFLKEIDNTNDSELAIMLREAIEKIDNQFIKTLQSGELFMGSINNKDDHVKSLPEKLPEMCLFTSHCRFPIYEVDFGWGKPSRVCPAIVPYKNQVILMPTSFGQGIEAWVHLASEEDFAFLQHHHHLLSISHN